MCVCVCVCAHLNVDDIGRDKINVSRICIVLSFVHDLHDDVNRNCYFFLLNKYSGMKLNVCKTVLHISRRAY